MAAGRPPLPRGVHSIADAKAIVPPELVFDTSFVVRTLVRSEPFHEQCLNFVYRLIDANSVVVFSHLLELELAEIGYRLGLKEKFGSDWMKGRHDGRTRRRATRRMEEVLAAWSELLTALSWVCVTIDEVAASVPEFMGCGLSSYDAVHAATGDYADVTAIATTDVGFARLPSTFHLYVDSSRVAACRKARGGAGA